MLKHILINISKTKKLYIPFLIIITLVLLTLMYFFALRDNIISAHKQHIGKYAAAAITHGGLKGPYSGAFIGIDDAFIETYNNPEYISDYYAFTERTAGSDMLQTTPYTVNQWGAVEGLAHQSFLIQDHVPLFTLMIYSDIEKSTHFRVGDRRIIEGRFAETPSECNISAELAEVNRLSVGDSIKIYTTYGNHSYDFEIAGIYEDNTMEATTELMLVYPRVSESFFNEDGVREVWLSSASHVNLSRNQILTAAPTMTDLAVFDLYKGEKGDVTFNAVVYYAHDEKSILAFAEETDDLLPPQFMTLDSGDTLRSVYLTFEDAEKSFTRLLIIVSLVSAVFCALIIFYILKDRTYDIGVFRTRGMSRVKTAFLVSGEVFTVSVLAFSAAFALYVTTFTNVVGRIYSSQWSSLVGEAYKTGDFRGSNMSDFAFISAREHIVSLSFTSFLLSFLVTVTFSAIVGLAATLFIARHEPMKTMTRV